MNKYGIQALTGPLIAFSVMLVFAIMAPTLIQIVLDNAAAVSGDPFTAVLFYGIPAFLFLVVIIIVAWLIFGGRRE